MPACLLDSNVWLAAALSEHPAHAHARGVLRSASAVEPALWCRATQQSFLRLAPTPAITQAYASSAKLKSPLLHFSHWRSTSSQEPR